MNWLKLPHPAELIGSEELPDGDTYRPAVGLAQAAAGFLAVAGHALQLKAECESPIEVLLGAEIKARLGSGRLVPQYHLSRYRYDFAIEIDGRLLPVLLIECDGQEFHSTPEQVENDKAKDAAAAAAGIPLLRFTGSDINSRTAFCLTTIFAALERARCR